MREPGLETLIIPGADPAAVLTCPQKLAHKLQGEEASPEDQPGKYEESLSQALKLSKAAQRLEIMKSRPIFLLVCGNRADVKDVFCARLRFFLHLLHMNETNAHRMGKKQFIPTTNPNTIKKKEKQEKAFMTPSFPIRTLCTSNRYCSIKAVKSHKPPDWK